MRKVWDIAVNDLRIYFREPGSYIGIFLIPVIFSVVLGLAFGGGGGPSQLRVDVIDNDQSALSGRFLSDLRAANAALVLCPFDNNEEDYCRLEDDPALTEERSVNRLANNTASALIIIPEGFETQLAAGEPVSIGYRSNENAAAPGYILQAVQAVTQRMGGALVAARVGENIASDAGLTADAAATQNFRQEVYDRAAALWAEEPFRVDYQQSIQTGASANATQQGFGQSVPGMASMFVTFLVLISGIILVRERKQWTLQRLIVMPVTRGQVIGGKILMYFMLGMIQYLAMFIAGWLVTWVLSMVTSGDVAVLNLGNDLFALLAVMVSLTLCMTALGLLIATLVKSEMQGAAMLNLLGLTLAPLGGAWWSLDIVPPFMRTVGHISPIAWAMDAFNKLLFRQGTLVDILPELGVMLALAAVFFIIAIARFKYD